MLIKTLSQTLKQDKEKFRAEVCQQAIRSARSGRMVFFRWSKYSRTFRFTDINIPLPAKRIRQRCSWDYSEL